ncbi:MAG: adenylate/guanylate cyclase domain-containing protein [Bacteroidota bacterium]
MTTEQKVTRKLRAILSADVKGYSLLMTNDEISTIKTLKEYRDIMSKIIKKHSGRVVDALGDNMLAEFSSAVNAVQCSVEIQKELKTRNAELPDDKRLEFRIGVNIGDVVQDGDSVYGEGVNIAARIEGLADPSSVCISRGAYDHVKNKLKLGYEFIGEHAVKNIKDPVRVYKVLMDPDDAGKRIGERTRPLTKKWIWPLAAVIVILLGIVTWQFYQKTIMHEFEPASVENMAFPLPEKPSIAVLAFDNMTGDSSQEYFSDGIAEEIITVLSMVGELFVIARNSSFAYKGKPVNIQQVSKELGVRYVLEGSVRRSGEKVRVTAQLIDAINGQHIWAESYDRDFDNIFEIQDEITMKVVSNLRIKLTEGEQARIMQHTEKNPEIYKKHLQWLANWRQGGKEGLERCGQLAQEMIDIAPESETGYRSLGWYHYNLARGGKSPRENTKKAFKMAQKGLSIDESNGFSHSLLGWVYVLMKKYEKAIASGKRSVELQPNGALVHMLFGSTLGYAGHFDEAIVYLKRAMRLNPFPAYYYYYHLGLCYIIKGQFEDALTEYEKMNQRAPELWLSHWSLAVNYIYLDRNEEARASAAKALELNPHLSVSWILKVSKYKNPAHTQYFLDAMRKAGFPE